MIITFNLCAWCRRKYYLELQMVQDDKFCTPKCRQEWETSLNESNQPVEVINNGQTESK